MHKLLSLLLHLLLGTFCLSIQAQSQYPADISYMIADFKYNKEDGLKICEVQHGSLSALKGDLYLNGGDGAIPVTFTHLFTELPINKWAAGTIYAPLKRSLKNADWNIKDSFQLIEKDPCFMKHAKQILINPSSILSYQGIVYADYNVFAKFDIYQKKYPGILFMNAATFPYWKDKYKMNALFDCNEELKQYKADWRLYPKKYDPLLVQKIQEDMPAEMYVIKPRKEFLGNGVIVVAGQDIDNVLKMIAQPDLYLKNHPDPKYAYWCKHKDDTIIVEKYYASDYLCYTAPINQKTSPSADNNTTYHYDTAMRLVFILQYDCGVMSYHCLGGFCKLPSKALEEEGTLNEKTISYCKDPFYKLIEPELFAEVNAHMERAMLLLYDIMLHK